MGIFWPKPTLQMTVNKSITATVGMIPAHSYMRKLIRLTNSVKKANTNMMMAQSTTVKKTFKKNVPKLK
jgi:hypothetical protein